jgi:hypothetical protein
MKKNKSRSNVLKCAGAAFRRFQTFFSSAPNCMLLEDFFPFLFSGIFNDQHLFYDGVG